MSNYKLRFRHIHLDFHTSEKISSICEAFDEKKFAQTLKNASVNSISCFARCHHGMMYYDSKKFPELVHPGLKQKNLLERQIKACHDVDIKTPVYTTVQWDYYNSQKHPEWVCINADGSFIDFCKSSESAKIYEAGFYRTLCVNTPYRDFLKEHIKDIFDVLKEVDGLFLDIVNTTDCSCKYCVEGMIKEGFNAEVKEERLIYAQKMIDEFKRDMSSYIRTFQKDAPIFYNSSHISPLIDKTHDAYSHYELESLPSGGWGYTHFTNSVRYARTTGFDLLSHTGKFHTSWGDFHSFKNKEALEYECLRMLAYNAKCLIGDQLDPDGNISTAVYDLIGSVYSEVAKKEKWCEDAKAVVDIGVFTPEAFEKYVSMETKIPECINGICWMLDEMGQQFDIIEQKTDFSKYKVLILPDIITTDENLSKKIEDYVKGGGKLIASYKSGLNLAGKEFALPSLGVKYISDAPYSPDFLMPTDRIGKSLPKTEHVMYEKGLKVGTVGNAEVLSDTYLPYFNRTWEHFCSHRHTPSRHEKGYPGIVKNGNAIYFIHPIFTLYSSLHPKWCRVFFKDALDMLLPDPLLRHNGPTTLVSTLNAQKDQHRYVLHAFHYIPEKRGTQMYTIEDIIPLYNTEYSLCLEHAPKNITLVPENEKIDFKTIGKRIVFTIPKIEGHNMVAIEY